jgi:hypothetical protein
MRLRASPTENADDLDLPPLDGEDDEDIEAAPEALEEPEDAGDAFDDATHEDAPVNPEDLSAADGAEGGWLVDTDDANTLDVGTFDLGSDEEKILEDDEPDGRAEDDDLTSDEESVTADGGEEGPLADDEELREEDLPALDADEDGDVADEDLYDRSAIGADEDLRWDDRAWERVAGLTTADADVADDSGLIAVLGEEATQSSRDATWRHLDDTGRVMAAVFVPGDAVVIALAVPDRSRALLVRIYPDGAARIIAEIDPAVRSVSDPSGIVEDDGEACVVSHLRWDAGRGALIATGSFGIEGFSPS